MRGRFTSSDLEKRISEALDGIDFKKRGRSWFRTTKDVIQVVHLQRSVWGKRYYVNLGLMVRAWDKDPFPPAYRCHIVGRISQLDSCDPRKYEINLEKAGVAADVDRTMQALRHVGKAFFTKTASFSDLQKFVRSAPPALMITGEAREFFNLCRPKRAKAPAKRKRR